MCEVLEAKNIYVNLGNKKIVNDVSFKLHQNEWLMLVGPNGAGKTTLLKALAGDVSYNGKFIIEGQNIRRYNSAQFAKKVGFLSQSNHVLFDFSVEEIVSMGRYSYHDSALIRKQTSQDKAAIDSALQKTGTQDLKIKSILELSGGERQRVFLAQVFAQDPNILVLDEPTNNLDITFQEQIFNMIKKWVSQPGKSVISVVHDLSLAKIYGNSAVLLADGKMYAMGPVKDVLSSHNINTVYKSDVDTFIKKLLQGWAN